MYNQILLSNNQNKSSTNKFSDKRKMFSFLCKFFFFFKGISIYQIRIIVLTQETARHIWFLNINITYYEKNSPKCAKDNLIHAHRMYVYQIIISQPAYQQFNFINFNFLTILMNNKLFIWSVIRQLFITFVYIVCTFKINIRIPDREEILN